MKIGRGAGLMPITAKQRRVYDFIRGFIQSNDQPPTIAEIGQHFRISSTASVHGILLALEREGLIKRTPNISRGIEIVKPSPNGDGDRDGEIPLLGIVAAGQPIEAILNDTIAVPRYLVGRARNLPLRVPGDPFFATNIQAGAFTIVSAQAPP